MLNRCAIVSLFAILAFSTYADIHVTRGFLGENREMKFIDDCGNALAVYSLGEFDLVGAKLPLYAYWTSAAEQSKSLFGYGWHVPWFECRMLPASEKTYDLHSMFGERLRFVRDGKNPKLFRHHDSACATIGKNDIKVYLGKKPGNMPDMVFFGGRLVQFKYASRVVKLEYDEGRRFRRMTCGGKTVLSVETRSYEPDLIRIVYNGNIDGVTIAHIGEKRVCIGCSDRRPEFESRRTLVGLSCSSLGDLKFSYGKGGDVGMMSDGKVGIDWDPRSRRLLRCDDWLYDLSRHDPDNGVYQLRRERGDEVEEYSYNVKSGIRFKSRRGVRETVRLFTSGRLRGKSRWSERYIPGGFGERTECSYDEKGILVYFKRINLNDKTYVEIWNDDTGRIAKSRSNGDDTTACEYIFTPNGERVVVRADGKIIHHGVPNAEDFVKWHEEVKKGRKVPMPKAREPPPLPVLDVTKGTLM